MESESNHDVRESLFKNVDLHSTAKEGTSVKKNPTRETIFMHDPANTGDPTTSEQSHNFEDILKLVGSTGRFQIFIYILVNISFEFAASCATTYFIIEGANPGWTCVECLKVDNVTGQCDGFDNNVTEGTCNDYATCYNMTFDTKYTSIVSEVIYGFLLFSYSCSLPSVELSK